MSEMIGKVVKAIMAEETGSPGQYEAMARAAIEAMREPTDAMCEAAEWHQQSDVNNYQRAIDEALK